MRNSYMQTLKTLLYKTKIATHASAYVGYQFCNRYFFYFSVINY